MYRWTCSQCGYKALVGGGPERGFSCARNTFHCKTCQQLMDLTTTVFCKITLEDIASNVNKDKVIIPRCRYCKGEVDLWDTEKKECPCCGATMKRGSEILWD